MGKKRRRGARLEMTSLMDVMFLVLVFFIYCIFDMTVHRGLKVDLPRGEGQLEKGERIVITITAENALQVNGKETAREAILSKVKNLAAVQADVPVIISGDRRASLGTGSELLAELKAAGIEKVSFQVSGQP
jgi:biopolymer transport protein ExbD